MSTQTSPRYVMASKHLGFIEKATEKALLNRSEETIHRILFHINRFKEDFSDVYPGFASQIENLEHQLSPKKPFEILSDTTFNDAVIHAGSTITTDEAIYELKEIRFYTDSTIKLLLEDPFGEQKEISKSDLESMQSLAELDVLMETEEKTEEPEIAPSVEITNDIKSPDQVISPDVTAAQSLKDEIIQSQTINPVTTTPPETAKAASISTPSEPTTNKPSEITTQPTTDINSLIDSLIKESSIHPKETKNSTMYDPVPREELLKPETMEVKPTREWNAIDEILAASFPDAHGKYEIWEHLQKLDPKRAIPMQGKDGISTSLYFDAYTFLHPEEFHMKINPDTSLFVENLKKLASSENLAPQKGESIHDFLSRLFV